MTFIDFYLDHCPKLAFCTECPCFQEGWCIHPDNPQNNRAATDPAVEISTSQPTTEPTH